MTTKAAERERALLDACLQALALIDTSIYQGEAFATHSDSVSAELEKGHIKSSQSGFECGIGVRVFKNLSLIHISEPTRRTPISYAVFCLTRRTPISYAVFC